MTTKQQKEIRGEGIFWVLLCDCSVGDPLICGVYPSLKEARNVAKDVNDCVAKHTIERCRVKITLLPKSGKTKKI